MIHFIGRRYSDDNDKQQKEKVENFQVGSK